MLTRRHFAAATMALAALNPALARAADADTRMAERSLGDASAKMVVQEWFSLTCTHCAAFSREVFPEVRAKLIDTGKIRYVFRDFPLDQVALKAAMIARALPPAQYETFVSVLLASQDRWAFARGVNTEDALAKQAALAGMPRDVFETTMKDDALQAAILKEQSDGESKYKVDSTPTFVFNEKPHAGELSFEEFAKLAGVGV